MTIALSASGARAASCSALKPPHEMPNMPTAPVDQGCAASQAITASPSRSSCSLYSSSNSPSDDPVPRMSTRTDAYPCAAYQGCRSESRGAVQSSSRYGRYSSRTGTGAASDTSAGAQMRVCRRTPSGIGIHVSRTVTPAGSPSGTPMPVRVVVMRPPSS